ncbi:MAG: hypothetical protein CMN55_04050 [Sneathiella sp.]|nr:hypothetical protein [Sneathiella sp.]
MCSAQCPVHWQTFATLFGQANGKQVHEQFFHGARAPLTVRSSLSKIMQGQGDTVPAFYLTPSVVRKAGGRDSIFED